MLVPCAYTQSPDSQRRAPCQQSLSPTSFPGFFPTRPFWARAWVGERTWERAWAFRLLNFGELLFSSSLNKWWLFSQGKYCGVRMKKLKISRTYFANNEEQTIFHERTAKSWHMNARSEPVPSSQLHHPTEKRVGHNFLHMRVRSLSRLD